MLMKGLLVIPKYRSGLTGKFPGYAAEAAKACKRYAFETLNAEEVCSIIRDTNIASQNVAIRNGMAIADSWTKHYRGVDMPHYRYVVIR